MITELLAIIAIIEGIRLGILFKPTTKRGYFKTKMKGVQQTIFDLEFKIHKLRELRERTRHDRDDRFMRKEALLEEVKRKCIGFTEEELKKCADEKNGDEDFKNFLRGKIKVQKELDEVSSLIDKKILLDRDIKRLEDQMKLCDVEINGLKPTASDQQGSPGVVDQIESLIELKRMLKDWIKKQ